MWLELLPNSRMELSMIERSIISTSLLSKKIERSKTDNIDKRFS